MAVASILVSEADPDVRRLLVVLIERLGHVAVVLERGVEILPRADLLLMDPAAAGSLDHARLARQLYPDMPIVCMGARPSGQDYLFSGPISLLEKPFTLEALQSTLGLFAASPV
ncbi:MAG: Response regulator receiver domain [Gaiellaceae bacterium]|nr:Response regulator receiver domain [Gaiellaceae bacterium]